MTIELVLIAILGFINGACIVGYYNTNNANYALSALTASFVFVLLSFTIL